jgi:hypothetical protein
MEEVKKNMEKNSEDIENRIYFLIIFIIMLYVKPGKATNCPRYGQNCPNYGDRFISLMMSATEFFRFSDLKNTLLT